jgi:hypothetical protein
LFEPFFVVEGMKRYERRMVIVLDLKNIMHKMLEVSFRNILIKALGPYTLP